jgi:hypothetical protein
LSLDFLAGVVDFADISAIYGYQIDNVVSGVAHVCGVLSFGFGRSPGRWDGEVIIEDWTVLSVSVSCIIAKSDATRPGLFGDEAAWLQQYCLSRYSRAGCQRAV